MNYHEFGHNIKVYNLPDVEGSDILSDDEMNRAYYNTIESFWLDLCNQTREDFGVDCWSEGRSGGWAVFDTGNYEAPKEWHNLVDELVESYSQVFYPDEVAFWIDEKKAELNSCDIFKAANHVKDNVGKPVAIIETGENQFFAVAKRSNAPFEGKEYSTHWVYPRGCESGHYDLTKEEAYQEFNSKSHINIVR